MARRSVTIAEAAKLTGLSKEAIRSRIDRGSLRASKKAGVRRVPLDELAELGLLAGGEDVGDRSPLTVDQLLDRLERQAEQIGGRKPDFNRNGVDDAIDIVSGQARDGNDDGVPDSAQR